MCCCNNCNTTQDPIQFIIGDGKPGTPTNGTNIYSNATIKFLKYLISKNGYGYLIEDVNYERLSSGGFKLLGTNIFITDECFTITFY